MTLPERSRAPARTLPGRTQQRFAPAAERLPMERVDAWRLTRLLGQGGMGAVYLAERDDGLYQQKVAIKFLRAAFASKSLKERFERERRLLARLRKRRRRWPR